MRGNASRSSELRCSHEIFGYSLSVHVSVDVTISLDGFIEIKGGTLDRRDETIARVARDEDCGQQSRFRSRVMTVAVRRPS